MAQILNNKAYEIEADNLVLAAQYPILHRIVTIANPEIALKRGMAVINASGTLYIAGTQNKTGSVIGIISADRDAAEGETVAVDVFVSGAFNVAAVTGINDWDASSVANVLGAQGNGIYLL